ncbi:MAG: trypsin-like peptidase domain-containing protein [Gemmatimonadetes bacterium]|nr:trypsin-like peptidase domain-containing protein [Gemmatimonadota bacterium]
MSLRLTRSRILAVGALAFVGGVFFASSMDWTDRLFAQGTPGSTRPRQEQVQTLADASNAFVSISEHITPAVVAIEAERDPRARPGTRRQQAPTPGQGQGQIPPGFEEFFRQFDPQQQQPRSQESSGSGFIVSRDGYILTNNHVVEGADRVRVKTLDRRVHEARIIGRDPTTDVAVLKIEGRNFTAITFGDDEKVRIGEWVLAIGNPLGLDFTVTAGIVSAKGRGLAGLARSNYDISDFIQTDAAINPGNSGGPLVNARGEVIGINSAIASQTGFYSGYGFAIPITLAKQVMDDLIQHGEVRRAVAGVSIGEVTPEDAQVAGLREITGVKVQAYSGTDSPALRAGIEPGDIITKADGRAVDRVSALQRVLRGKKPGDTVELEAWRYGTRKTFSVRLIAAPRDNGLVADASSEEKPDASPTHSRLGIAVEPVPAELVRAARIPEEYRGVRVAEVEPGSPSEGRLVVGDVIVQILPAKTKVMSTADLQRGLEGVRNGEIVSFLIYRPARDGAGTTAVVNVRAREAR